MGGIIPGFAVDTAYPKTCLLEMGMVIITRPAGETKTAASNPLQQLFITLRLSSPIIPQTNRHTFIGTIKSPTIEQSVVFNELIHRRDKNPADLSCTSGKACTSDRYTPLKAQHAHFPSSLLSLLCSPIFRPKHFGLSYRLFLRQPGPVIPVYWPY
jgi:hypothetical protein